MKKDTLDDPIPVEYPVCPIYGEAGFDGWIETPHEELWKETQSFVVDYANATIKMVSELTDTELRNLCCDLMRESNEVSEEITKAYQILGNIMP